MSDEVTKVSPLGTEEEQQLRKWRSEFQLDYNAYKNWQDKKQVWEKFYDGDQLSPEEKKALRDRNQPEVVINLIKPRIDGVIGDFLGRRVMMRARDKGSADFNTAKHITEALRFIEEQNRFDDQEAKVAEDLFIGGVGWYKVGIEFDFLEPEIKIAYRDNDDVIVDRRSRKRDLSDAKRLWETVWVEVEDLVELYPQFEKEIISAANQQEGSFVGNYGAPGENYLGDDYAQSENVASQSLVQMETFTDPKRNRVRLINVWERVQKRVVFAYHPDMKDTMTEITDYSAQDIADLKESFPSYQVFNKTKTELNSGLFLFNKVLDYRENVREHDSAGKFPFARALGHVERSNKNIPYGMVKQYIDAQREYNKRRSKLLHKSNTNRIIAEAGAVAKHDIERTRKEAARPDGYVEFNPGKQFRIDSDSPAQTDVFLLQLAQSEIEASGIANEFVGTENKQLSGVAISLRQSGGQKMLRPFYAALRAARRDIFHIALEEIQQYWTSEKLVKITDDPDASDVILNQRSYDPETGKLKIENNLRLGKYDIKIDEDLETANERSEQLKELIQFAELTLKAGQPFPLDLAIKASNIPNKDEWLSRIAEMEKQRQAALQQQLSQQSTGAA